MKDAHALAITVVVMTILATFAAAAASAPVSGGEETEFSEEKEEYTVVPLGGEVVSVKTYTAGNGYIWQNYLDIPDRVVCGSSTFLNIAFYFGLEDKIVGLYYDEEPINSDYADKYAALIERIGDDHRLYGDADVDTLTAWNPDLIVGWASGFKEGGIGSIEYWNNHGCNLWALESMCGDKDIKAMIYDYINLGRIFDIEDQTDAFIDTFETKLDSVKGCMEGSDVAIAFYDSLQCTDLTDEHLWMYGADTFIGDVLDHIGANNPYPGGKLDISYVEKKSADIDILFFVCYGDCTHDTNYAAWTSNEVLAECPAITSGNVKDMELSLAFGGDPAVLDMLDDLEELFSVSD